MRTFKIFIKYSTYLFYIYKHKTTSFLCIMIDNDTSIDSLACLFEENENDNFGNPNRESVLNTESLDDTVSNNQMEINEIINDIYINTSNSDLTMVPKTDQQNTGAIDSELKKTIPESLVFGWGLMNDCDNNFLWETPLLNQQTNEQSSFEIAGNGSSMTEIDPESSNRGIRIQSNPLKRQYLHKDPCSSKKHRDLEKSEFSLALNSLSSLGTYIEESEQSEITTNIELELVIEISPFFSKIEETIEIIHKFRYPFVILNSLKPRILQKKAEICKSNLSLEPLNKRLNELKNKLIAFEPYLKQSWENRGSLIKNYKLKKNNISCFKTLHDRYLKEKGDPNTFEFLRKLQAQYKITQIAIKDTLVDLSKHEYHNIVTNESLEIFESIFDEYIVPTFELKFIGKDEKISERCFFRIKFISEKQIYFYYTCHDRCYITGLSSILYDSRTDKFINYMQNKKRRYRSNKNAVNVFFFSNFRNMKSAMIYTVKSSLVDWYKIYGESWDYILTDKEYEEFLITVFSKI